MMLSSGVEKFEEKIRSVSADEMKFSLSTLRSYFFSNQICPPRTGHLGDWSSFIHSHGTSLDFNSHIYQLGFGKPLIVGTNWSENSLLSLGDLVYRPGSILQNGKQIGLDLFVKSESEIVSSEKERSYFSPFLMTKFEGELVSLVEFHRRRFKQRTGQDLDLEADFLIENKEFISQLIRRVVLTQTEGSVKKVLANVFSHLINSNGEQEVIREFVFEDKKILLNNVSFVSVEELIERSFIIPKIQNDNSYFMDQFSSQSGPFPLFSGVFIFCLEALLSVDRQFELSFSKQAIKHFHWGARNMAGIPPLKKGYFFGSSMQRKVKTLFEAFSKALDTRLNGSIYLLPAALFLLIPDPSEPRDAQILADYFAFARAHGLNPLSCQAYLEKLAPLFSPLFLNRLCALSFYDLTANDYSLSESDIPTDFFDLPISFLSFSLGFLYELALQQREATP